MLNFRNRLEILKLLVSKGLSVDAEVDQHSLLAYAIQNEPSLEIAEYLIKEGADINKWNEAIRMSYPLAIACKLGYIDLVRVLLEKGAMLSQIDNNGMSLLDTVAEVIYQRDVGNHLGIFQCLVEYGAETRKSDVDQKSQRHSSRKKCFQCNRHLLIVPSLKEVQKANEQFQEWKNQLFHKTFSLSAALQFYLLPTVAISSCSLRLRLCHQLKQSSMSGVTSGIASTLNFNPNVQP